jgi:hypothetical protein
MACVRIVSLHSANRNLSANYLVAAGEISGPTALEVDRIDEVLFVAKPLAVYFTRWISAFDGFAGGVSDAKK